MTTTTYLLTQAQVNALPDGTQVVIIWSGGNGPHRYVMRRSAGVAWAAYAVGSAEVVVAPLDGVGAERCQTRVWLAGEDEGGRNREPNR